MKKFNNRKANKKQKNIPLLKNVITSDNSRVTTDVVYTVLMYYSGTTKNVSLNTGSDIRYLTFSAVIGATYPFVDFAKVYDEFKINYASLVVMPYSAITLSLPPMHVTCDPDGPASNPTNLTVINSMNGHDFNVAAITPKSVKYLFPGVGISTQIWLDTATAPSGAFYFGMNTTALSSVTDTLLYEMSFMLNVSFRGIKGY